MEDILPNILEFLPIDTIMSCSRINKLFRKVYLLPSLWKYLMKRDYKDVHSEHLTVSCYPGYIHHYELRNIQKIVGYKMNTNAMYVELEHNNMTRLPKVLCKFKNMYTLNMSYNELTQIPTEIGQLTNLRKLFLGSNKLRILPTEIGQLHNLTHLGLSFNELNRIPTELGKIYNLMSLHLNNNLLKEFPMEIENLVMLKYVDLSCNPLVSIPDSIKTITKTIIL
jgi:Leucine-rich repeat (LRR) protein